MKFLTLIKGIFARIIVGLSGILIARYLSKNDYGLIVSVANIATFFLTASRLGLNEYTVVKAAKAQVSSSKRACIVLMDKLQNSATLLMLLPGLVATLLLIPQETTPWLSIAIFLLVYSRGYIDSIRIGVVGATLQTNGNNQKFVDSQLIFSFAAVLSLAALYLLDLEIIGYLIASLVASLSMFVAGTKIYGGFLNNGKIIKPRLPTRRQFKVGFYGAVLKKSSYFLSEIMAFGYTQGSAIVLISVTSSAEVARYAVIASLIAAGYIIPGVIYQWTLPLLAESTKSKHEYMLKAKKAIGQITIITLPVAAVMASFSTLIIRILLGTKYASSASVLEVMALVYFAHSLCFIPAAVLTSLGQQRKRVQLQMISATIGIGVTATIGATYGGIAAAYGCLVAEIFLLLGYSLQAFKTIENRNWLQA